MKKCSECGFKWEKPPQKCPACHPEPANTENATDSPHATAPPPETAGMARHQCVSCGYVWSGDDVTCQLCGGHGRLVSGNIRPRNAAYERRHINHILRRDDVIEQFYKWSTRVCILSFVLAIVAFVATVYNGSNGSIIVSGLLAALYIIISGFILALLLRGFGELLRILGGIEDKMG